MDIGIIGLGKMGYNIALNMKNNSHRVVAYNRSIEKLDKIKKKGIFLRFNSKEPGSRENIIPIEMDYCQSCRILPNSVEAYKRLLPDIINGDQTLFTSWDEVKYSWKIIDSIELAWRKYSNNKVYIYPAGKDGPEASNQLLIKHKRHWWNTQGGDNENL